MGSSKPGTRRMYSPSDIDHRRGDAEADPEPPLVIELPEAVKREAPQNAADDAVAEPVAGHFPFAGRRRADPQWSRA